MTLKKIAAITAAMTLAGMTLAHAADPLKVYASKTKGTNIADNTVDGDLSTRWVAKGTGEYIQYQFDENITLDAIKIAFFKGDSRTVSFQIESTDTPWKATAVWDQQPLMQSSGDSTALQTFKLDSPVTAKYFRIVGHGFEGKYGWNGSLNAITEVEFVDHAIKDEPVIVTATASSDDGNVASNVLDKNLDTRWSANGDGEYITFDLGAVQTVGSVGVAFYSGDSRTTDFDVYVGESEDSLNLISSHTSSGDSSDIEKFVFVQSQGRFVRIVGHGNSENSWNSVTEVEIYSDNDVVLVAPIAKIMADENGVIGSAVSVDASGSFDPDGGDIVSYDWTFGDGAIGSGLTANHTYTTSGEYTVSLTVVDDEGVSTSASQIVNIVDWQQDPIAVINVSSTITPDTPLQFTGTSSSDPDGGEIVSYAWEFGDGSTSNEANPEKTYSGEGIYTVSLTVTDDEGVTSTTSREVRVAIEPAEDLWAFTNASFEGSSSDGGWMEDDPSGVVSTNGTSNPQPPEGGRLLVITGEGGEMKQALYKPIAGHVYQVTAYIYGHGTIGINDLGDDAVYETTTNHGESWKQVSVTYTSTGSPAMVYAKYGNGTDDSYFDMFEGHDISTQADLDKTPPAKIMRYASQVLDVSYWKLTLPVAHDEVYTPDLYTFDLDEWYKLVQDEDGYAIQFRAPHGGATTSGSSNPRSEFRELVQNYHYQNSKSAASWSNAPGAGRHEMWIKQKVTHLTSVKPHVVVGQIHDSGDDVVVFRIEGHNGTCPEGTENDWTNCGTPGQQDTHANVWLTNGNTTHGYLVDGNYELGTLFEVKIIAENGQVSFEYNGETVPYTHDESFSGAYFKMGNYTQSHPGTAPNEEDGAYAETYIYDYYIKHEE